MSKTKIYTQTAMTVFARESCNTDVGTGNCSLHDVSTTIFLGHLMWTYMDRLIEFLLLTKRIWGSSRHFVFTSIQRSYVYIDRLMVCKMKYTVHRVRFIEYVPQAIHCMAVEDCNEPSRLALAR